MPLRTGTRNNVVAGLFVIASAILAVVISIIVSGAQKRLIPTNRYIIRFSLEQGAPGIKKGTIVSLGGQEVGRVTDVRKVPDPNGVPIAMDIHVAIRSDVKLYEDAWAFLERPLLGTNSTLNIASAGTGQLPAGKQFQGARPILEPGELLDGRVAPPSFLTQAGYGPEQIHQVQNMILQASQVVERIDRISAKFETEVNPNLTKFSSIVEDI